jgi:hypothetical protein
MEVGLDSWFNAKCVCILFVRFATGGDESGLLGEVEMAFGFVVEVAEELALDAFLAEKEFVLLLFVCVELVDFEGDSSVKVHLGHLHPPCKFYRNIQRRGDGLLE